MLCSGMLDLIVVINTSMNKTKPLEELGYKLETLRIHLRLAFDLKIISRGMLAVLNKQIEEIGKQIGGWQKWAANK